MSVKEYAMNLKLGFIKNHYEDLIKEAYKNNLSYEDFLNDALEKEINVRKQHSIEKRIKKAKFPFMMTCADYKRDHFSVEIKQKIRALESLEFIDNQENIILIGNPGTGKTALSIALGMAACLENKSVLFTNVPDLLIELSEAMSKNQITKYKNKFCKYDLVVLDELGYCTFDQQRGEILFNLLSSRNANGSMIITSNLTFDRWNEIFKDTVLTGAIIDRLAFKSHLIDMSGDSYRIIATQEWNERNNVNEKK